MGGGTVSPVQRPHGAPGRRPDRHDLGTSASAGAAGDANRRLAVSTPAPAAARIATSNPYGLTSHAHNRAVPGEPLGSRVHTGEVLQSRSAHAAQVRSHVDVRAGTRSIHVPATN